MNLGSMGSAGDDVRTFRLTGLRGQLDEGRGLCAELLALPHEEQEQAARRDPRFRNWGVCEELVRRGCMETEAGRPTEAAHFAALALALTARLDTAVHTVAVVQDLEAQAWACVGEARLRMGDTGGAEGALREAASRLAHGTGDLLVEARLLEFEAAVRRRQGRTREAAALLNQAEARYSDSGATDLAARAHLARRDA